MATVTKDFRIKSGLVVEGANATVNGSDVITEDIITGGTQTNIAVTYDAQNKVLNFVAENGVADSTTDDLSEGSSNKYFTEERAQDAAASLFTSGSHNGIQFTYDDDNNKITATVTGAAVPVFESGIVFEGSVEDENQTLLSITEPTQDNTVVIKDASGTLAFESDITDAIDALNTDAIEEGETNLYFTEQRAIDAVGGSATSANTPNTVVKRDGNGDFAAGTISANLTGDVTGTVSSLSNHDTDDLGEGSTNQYFTTSRARNSVSGGSGIDYVSSTGVISADLGNGLEFDGNGKIRIDDSIVATDEQVSTAVGDHSDLTTGVHGVDGDVVGTSDAQTLTNKELGLGTTLGADVDAEGFTITNLGEPTQASDAATKGYVDAVAEGLHVHASVAALADSNVSLPTAPAIVDGVSLSVNDRVLLVGQTNKAENGIYVVINGDLARAADYNTAAEIQAGDFVFVSGGTVYGSTGWVQKNNVNTLGTDLIEWSQFSGAGTYTAGNGLTLTGTEFSIDTSVTATNTSVGIAVGDHSDLTTGVHGVAGDVVGTSDTQTLTNKTLGTGSLLSADLDAANDYTVKNLKNPSSDKDAATKKYVDDSVADVQDAVDNLTTTDVPEPLTGATNLYFTDARAVSAIQAVVPNFTEVDINSVAKQVAATGTVVTASTPTPVYQFAHASYRTAKFLVKTAYGTHTQVSEILLTLDSSDNVAITEYAIVGTNGNIADISADVFEGNVRITVNATNNNTAVTVAGTLLS